MSATAGQAQAVCPALLRLPGQEPSAWETSLASVPLARRSLIGSALGVLQKRSKARTGQPSRLAAAVQQHVGTFAACAAATSAAFMHGPTWGLGFLAGSFLLLDFKIQG